MAILTSLSPNTETDDVTTAGKSLFTFWSWRDAGRIDQIEKRLSAMFGSRQAVLTSSGRSAIYYLIQALGIGDGDEVIIQAFTCLAVPSAIKWSGAKPIYADIKLPTYNLDPDNVKSKITNRTRAIIVQHTFGIPAPLTELKQIARDHNLILIEDLAHSLGGTFANQPLGTHGDAAILSFGRDKIISSVFGGAIVTNNNKLADELRLQQNNLVYPPLWWIKQQLLHPIFMSFIKPLYFFASLGKIFLVILQRIKILSLAVSTTEKRGERPRFINWRYSPALAQLLIRQLIKLNRFNQRRRMIAQRYSQELRTDFSSTTIQDSAWLRFPVLVEKRPDILQAAKSINILLGDWYTTPVTPCSLKDQAITGYLPGSCPNAEYASSHIINLPTHPTMTDAQVGEVIGFINDQTPMTNDQPSPKSQ